MAVRGVFPAGQALATADGPTVATAVATPGVDASPTPLCQIPPIWELGMRLKVHAHGYATVGTTATTGTFTLNLAQPATAIASSKLISTTAAITLPVSITNGPWDLYWWGKCVALSTPALALAGQLSGRGRFIPHATLSTFGVNAPMPPTYAGRLSALFDTTLPQNLLIGIALSQVVGPVTAVCEELSAELSG
jgi:hypothetical protein